MRLQDVVHPHLDGLALVVETHAGSISMHSYLQLPDGVAYLRRSGHDGRVREATIEAVERSRVLEIGIYGPDPVRHGPETDALGVIRRLGPGDRCLILLGYPADALPFHRLLGVLGPIRGQVIQVSPLDYDHIRGAAIVTATDTVMMPRDVVGQPLAPSDDGVDQDVLRRIANEFVFTDFVTRNLRARQDRAARDVASARADAERAGAEVEQAAIEVERAVADVERAAAEVEALRVETERLGLEAQDLRAEAKRARSTADRVSGSTSYQLGRLLVGTAGRRRPVTALPRSLVRLWRRRGHQPEPARDRPPGLPGSPPPTSAATIVSTPRVDSTGAPGRRGDERRFLADSAVTISDRVAPVVLGILTDSTAGALRSSAIVNRATPNDALVVLDRTEPDLLLVEAAAFSPSHPWAYASNAAAVERAMLLLELIERAHVLGRPAVLVRDLRSADHVGLVPLEAKFDLVVSAIHAPAGAVGWSRGVQLGLFNPIGAPPERDIGALFVGGFDPRIAIAQRRSLEATLTMATTRGLDIRLDADADDGWDSVPAALSGYSRGRMRWSGLPSLYRRSRVAIANPFSVRDRVRSVDPRTLEQLACGLRIVSGPNQALAVVGGSAAHLAASTDDAAVALDSALQAGDMTDVDMRAVLRTLFTYHATPVMLSRLTKPLGARDPLASRASTAVLDLRAGANVERIVDSLIHQVVAPTRAIVRVDSGASWTTSAGRALAEASIEAQVTMGDRSVLAELMRAEPTAWLAPWPVVDSAGTTYLIDLLIGGEMTGADAVGYQSVDGFRFVERLDADASIVRTEVFRRQDHPPDQDGPLVGLPGWESGGWRYLSVGQQDPG